MTQLAVVTNKKKLDPALRERVRAALADGGFGGARWYEAPKGSAATGATEQALADGADVILVVGGDGTVRAAAHAVAHTEARLAVFPAGTANLFASALALPTEPAAVVDTILHGAVRTLDLGRCNGMRFGVMAGSGFDAALMRTVDDGPKERFGSLAYVWAGARQVRRQTPQEVRVDVDGEAFFRGAAVCVLVGNVGELKAGVKVFPDALPDDGELEVGIVTASTFREWAGVAAKVAVRRQATSPNVHLSRGSKIDVTWAPGASAKTKKRASRTPFELDGGAKGTARRLKYRTEPGALHLLVPAPDAPSRS